MEKKTWADEDKKAIFEKLGKAMRSKVPWIRDGALSLRSAVNPDKGESGRGA